MIVKLATAALAVVLFVAPVSAQQQCAPAPFLHAALFEEYGETIVDRMTEGDVEILLYANADSGSWTLVGVVGSMMCGVAAGENYTGQTIATIMDPAA